MFICTRINTVLLFAEHSRTPVAHLGTFCVLVALSVCVNQGETAAWGGVRGGLPARPHQHRGLYSIVAIHRGSGGCCEVIQGKMALDLCPVLIFNHTTSGFCALIRSTYHTDR